MFGVLASCSRPDYEPTAIVKDGAVVSVRDQKMAVMRNGRVVKTYPVSTSKFGLGDRKGSCRTPLGAHRIASKIGSGQPKGMVFKKPQAHRGMRRAQFSGPGPHRHAHHVAGRSGTP